MTPPASEAALPLEPLPAGKVSLAVLPLASPGGDARQERLADGISEDLISELGRYHDIAVIAKSSSFTYKGKTVDAREVGRELGVRYVLDRGYAFGTWRAGHGRHGRARPQEAAPEPRSLRLRPARPRGLPDKQGGLGRGSSVSRNTARPSSSR